MNNIKIMNSSRSAITRLLPLLLLLSTSAAIGKGGVEYPVSEIPAALKEDADAVVRLDQRTITIVEDDRAMLTVKRVVTVLSEDGESNGYFIVPYDKLRKMKSASARLLDKYGKELEKVKRKDMLDRPMHGSSFATDTRVLAYGFEQYRYPYTVVIEYEQDLRNMFTIPSWVVQNDENLAIQYAGLTVDLPAGHGLNFKGVNMEDEPLVSSAEGRDVYLWELRNVLAVEEESMAPSWRELVPSLYLIPQQFEVEGLVGRSDTWANLGQFFYDLNDGRQTLPADLVTTVHNITDTIANPQDKVQALYEMMQSRTRYVSIQLGIGGWQTFDATYVQENGYGDCKALTNYMKSILKEAGIESHAALVYAGDKPVPILTDFPSSQFNHVILCVPMDQDTVWLECTSQTQPFNYLGDFTEDRHVLLLTNEGGKLVKTPGSTTRMNSRVRTAHVFLQESGNAKVEVHVKASGFQQNYLRSFAEEYNRQDQEDYVQYEIKLGSYDLIDFKMEEGPTDSVPSYLLDYSLNARNVASKMGSRLFLSPNLLESSWGVLDEAERKHPIVRTHGFYDLDSVIIHLPSNAVIEAMPEQEGYETIFGTYASTLEMIDESTLLFTRTLEMEKIKLPASYYDQLKEFTEKMNKNDRQKVVLNNRS